LAENNLVKRNNETKKYSLGIGFVPLAMNVLENLDTRTIADPYLRAINEETQETIHLAVLLNDQVIYVDKRESFHSIRMYSLVGKAAPIHCTGVGKAVLAFQPENLMNRIMDKCTFEPFTEHTITNRESLRKECEEIRQNGYALDREEHEKGIMCIAAPIRDHTDSVIAAMSITTIIQRSKIAELVGYKRSLTEKCNNISKELGRLSID
jgi:IclR family transcriptional regulator, KDG regulon repressor